MIKAEKDTMIYPNDGEWWGCFAPDGKTRLQINETDWYKSDSFGLVHGKVELLIFGGRLLYDGNRRRLADSGQVGLVCIRMGE